MDRSQIIVCLIAIIVLAFFLGLPKRLREGLNGGEWDPLENTGECIANAEYIPLKCQPNNLKLFCNAFSRMRGDYSVSDCLSDHNMLNTPVTERVYNCAKNSKTGREYHDCYWAR